MKKIKCYIICHNNGWLVKNTVMALSKFLNIECIVVDNGSNGARTKGFLSELSALGVKIYFLKNNYGYNVISEVIKPQDNYYIITDPDLELCFLPDDTIDQLVKVIERTGAAKVGLALKLESDDLLEGVYFRGNTIATHELAFWENPVFELKPLEAYYANIDTTFALYAAGNKNQQIRLAGPYTVRHLPWHKSWIESTSANDLVEYLGNVMTGRVSTTSRLILQYINSKRFLKVEKRAEEFNVFISSENRTFWLNSYFNWEPETFDIFDKFADRSKIIVDIGAWIGPTVLYASRKYREVIGLEADQGSFKEITRNISLNKMCNVKLLPYALFNQMTTVHFGKNKFRLGAQENDSTSQIQEKGIGTTYEVKTITLERLLLGKESKDIALIKVDIEGGEEFVIEDLFNYHLKYGVPLFVSFHYDWWSNKDRLDGYRPLFDRTNVKGIVDTIRSSPFCSILIE
jgi:FkbM family methyltransferase